MALDDTTKKTSSTGLNPNIVDDAGGDLDAEGQFDDIKKELSTRFELLDDEIKKVIVDDNYQVQLFDIGKANKLTYEDLGTLEMETTMVLLGMVRPTDYRDELQVQLKLNDPQVDAIVGAVNEKVFTPIKTAIEKLYANKKDPADFLTPPDATTAPTAAVPSTAPTPAAAPSVAPKPAAASWMTPTPTVAPTTPGSPSVTPFSVPKLTTDDKNLLAKTGVIINDTPMQAPSAPIGSRSDLLQSIENPTKPVVPTPPAPAGIVADKLKTMTPAMPAQKTTDYTIAKPAPAAAPTTAVPPAKPGVDPYREPIG